MLLRAIAAAAIPPRRCLRADADMHFIAAATPIVAKIYLLPCFRHSATAGRIYGEHAGIDYASLRYCFRRCHQAIATGYDAYGRR